MKKNKILTIEETQKLAVKNHRENNFDEAQNLYNQILKIDPNNLIAHINLGMAFQSTGDYKKAKNCYEKALEINPNNEHIYNNFGILQLTLGEFQEAKNCYEKALEINPNFANAYKNLALVFKKLGDHENANINFIKTLKYKSLKSPERAVFAYDVMDNNGFYEELNLEQVKNDNKQLPMLTWPLLDYIQNLDLKDTTLHELGSGNSTIWFSNIFKEVESYETDKEWYETLKPKVKKNVLLKLVKLENIYECLFNFKSKDWLLIDFAGKRTKFVNNLVKLSDDKIPAQIIFDNSEWYRNGAKILIDRGYIEIPFYGFKSDGERISCTSLYLLKNSFNIKNFSEFYYPKFSIKISDNKWDTIK